MDIINPDEHTCRNCFHLKTVLLTERNIGMYPIYSSRNFVKVHLQHHGQVRMLRCAMEVFPNEKQIFSSSYHTDVLTRTFGKTCHVGDWSAE